MDSRPACSARLPLWPAARSRAMGARPCHHHHQLQPRAHGAAPARRAVRASALQCVASASSCRRQGGARSARRVGQLRRTAAAHQAFHQPGHQVAAAARQAAARCQPAVGRQRAAAGGQRATVGWQRRSAARRQAAGGERRRGPGGRRRRRRGRTRRSARSWRTPMPARCASTRACRQGWVQLRSAQS